MPNPLNPQNPLAALRNASGIGPDPYGVSDLTVSRGEMPILPLAASGGSAVLRGLRGLFRRPTAPVGAARALPGASEASSRVAPVMETLGEVSPEFTPQGGEALYNMGRKAVQGLAGPTERAYQRLASMMGR